MTTTLAEPDHSLRDLYDLHAPALHTYLLQITRGDAHHAEDIVQEACIRAWRHPEARGADGAWSRPWLFTVTRRIAIDRIRAAKVRPPETGDTYLHEQPDGTDLAQRITDNRTVREALAGLPDRFREVLVEIYVRDRPVSEVAARLGIPAGTVKSRTYYALKALREQLVARGFEG